MTSGRINLISLLAMAAVGAEVYLHNRYLSIAVSTAAMLCLVLGAIVVGAIPRRMRTRREKIARWIIGWPIFMTNLALMVVSCHEMWVLNAPEWVLIFAFFWVLAYLTWKIFIDPNTGFGGWWRRGPGPRPRGPAPRPSRSRPIPIRDSGAAVMRGFSVPK
jgi:hypothetical protein